MTVSAVSYLNTWPLVWGFLHGPQRDLFDFRFDLPATCAAALEDGSADIGLAPSVEVERLNLDFLPDLGIACEGPVRSILLISQRPFNKIRTLAVDSGSRTSVALSRLILAGRYDCQPSITPHAPRLDEMLSRFDAALIIGDPALHLDPETLPYYVLDPGAEWVAWTGLPMVFAVWAGHAERLTTEVGRAFRASYEWGLDRTGEMITDAVRQRGLDAELARKYLTEHIVYRLSARHLEGLSLFQRMMRELEPAAV